MAKPGAKRITLALQGGGAHGAFTWGVLDRLLQEPDLEIEGISGTSAGAINGAMLVSGFETGGPEGAREALASFWRAVADLREFSPMVRTAMDDWIKAPLGLDQLITYKAFEAMAGMLSPYQFNPFNVNPLQMALERVIDPGHLRTCRAIKLYVTATNVRTGKIKIFEREEMSIAALMASACLPRLFHTVVIDGEPYWDGGFVGNPAIFPLIYGCDSADVVIVQINPIVREEIPTTPDTIENRVNELSFNSSLMREIRAIAFVKRLIEEERLDRTRYKDLLIHMIDASAEMRRLGVASKFDVSWDFLVGLHDIGQAACDAWLTNHRDKLGQETSVDLEAYFL
jgi:NTE family protein